MTSCSIDYKAAVWDLRRTGDMGGVLRGPGEWSHLIVLPYGKDAQNCLDFLVIVLCMCPISYSAFLNLQMTRLEGETLEGTSFLLSLVLNRWAVFLSQILFSPFLYRLCLALFSFCSVLIVCCNALALRPPRKLTYITTTSIWFKIHRCNSL